MNATALQHLGKENEGSAYHNLAFKITAAPTAPRAALQENSATDYTRTDADGDAGHPKPEVPNAAARSDPSEGFEEARSGSKSAHAYDDEDWGPFDREAPTVPGSTAGLSLGRESAELHKDPTPTKQHMLVSVEKTCTFAEKVHPAGKAQLLCTGLSSTNGFAHIAAYHAGLMLDADMLDGLPAMEAGRCYTEILQLVKPKPDKSEHDGPFWRLPGPAFGPMQRRAGQGLLAPHLPEHSSHIHSPSY